MKAPDTTALSQEQQIALHKEVGRHVPAHFAKVFLNVELAEHQVGWIAFIDNGKRVVLLAPRDHGKSFTVTYAYVLWKLAYNKNLRILIISRTSAQAIKFLNQIREALQRYPLLISIFELAPDDSGNPWTRTMLYVKRTALLKDPSIECVGLGGSITGGHFDLIICDDIVEAGDENSSTGMATTLEWLKGTLTNLAEPNTRIIIVGTRKSYRDLYSVLAEEGIYAIRKEAAILQYPSRWDYLRSENGIITGVQIDAEDGQVLWPEKWSIQDLLLKRAELGPIVFDRELQNDPSGMKGNFLKLDWLHFVDELPPDDLLRNIYIGCDPAISMKQSADQFAVAVVREYKSGYWYLSDVFLDRLEFPEQVTRLESLGTTFKPRKMFVESVAYQSALSQKLIRDTRLPVFPVRAGADKSTRFLSLSPFFENGKVRVVKGINPEFVKQWVSFPDGKHDDALDAVFFALSELMADRNSQLLIARNSSQPKKPETWADFSKYFRKTAEVKT